MSDLNEAAEKLRELQSLHEKSRRELDHVNLSLGLIQATLGVLRRRLNQFSVDNQLPRLRVSETTADEHETHLGAGA